MWHDQSLTGGGGFVTSPSPSGGEKGSGQRVKRSTNIVPVAIRQLHATTDDTFRIDDMEVSVVTIVGLVTKVEVTTTKTAFTIDDQSGSIEAINYTGTDNDGASGKHVLLQEGTYGRIVGSLRTQKGGSGSKYLIIYKSSPVVDFNEVTAHGLEVLQVGVKLRKLKELEALKTGIGGGMNTSNMTTSMVGNSFDTSASVTSANSSVISGLTANQAMVFRSIQSVKGEEGVHVNQVIQNLKSKMNEKDIRSTIEFLSGEGHIYSTVDDDHYRSTDW